MSINHLIKYFYINNVYKLNPINIQRNIYKNILNLQKIKKDLN